jgi:TrmH family RNA methyltransferase
MKPPVRITSRQNPHVKHAAELRVGRERRRRKQFIIDGAREITRALTSGIRAIDVFIYEELCKSTDAVEARSAIENTNATVFSVSAEVFEKLAFGDRNDGIVVVAETPQRSMSDLRLPDQPLVAVLEGVEKPGNVGAILRSADAAGVDAIIIADGRTDLYNPNTIRSSLGTVFRPNVCEATTHDAIQWLQQRGLRAIAARPDAETLYTQADLRGGTAIVLGSEAAGLSDKWSSATATLVRLPMHGIADSLNVSTTAAVLFYEAWRQRNAAK